MAHELEIKADGTASMFSVAETPWHGLGNVIQEAPPTVEEAIKLAGLDWTVSLVDLVAKDSQADCTHKLVRRDTDGKHLGVVGAAWQPLQNIDAFKWFQPFVDAGFARFETAGALKGGTRVWVLAKVTMGGSDAAVIGDDTVRKYILLAHGHDGSLAIHCGFNPVRVVCMNTLRASLGIVEGQRGTKPLGAMMKVRHTKNAVVALDDLRDTMNLANETFEATVEQYRKLARHGFDQQALEKYVRVVFGYEAEKDLAPASKKIVDRVLELVDVGIGHDLKGVRGTWWAAYNGVTQYLSHEYGQAADSRYSELWFGQNAKRNDLALSKALELATA